VTIEQTYLELIGSLDARSAERRAFQMRIAELIARDEQPGHDDPLWMELDVAEAAERAAHQAVSEYQVRYIRPH